MPSPAPARSRRRRPAGRRRRARAAPLPRPELLALEQERIFERTWQLAGHVSQLPGAGQLPDRPGRHASRCSWSAARTARCTRYRNVCRHRGSRLLSGAGQCRQAIRCRYHGWTYTLEGDADRRPRGARRSTTPVDKRALGLLPARVEVMCGLVFVNLDPRRRAARRRSSAICPQRLERYGIADARAASPS